MASADMQSLSRNSSAADAVSASAVSASATLSSRLPALFAAQRHHFIYGEAPKLVYWEATQSCALACVHCRAAALAQRHPGELSTAEARALLRQIVSFGSKPLPHLVITGGDPLRRPDLFSLIDYGRSLGLSISVTPAGTAALTPEVIEQFQQAGVASLALSLDGATPAAHDAFRGVAGSFAWTINGARAIIAQGIPLQINTMVTAETLADLPQIYEVVKTLGITRWALFFLIATGRGSSLAEVSPAQSERLLNWLWEISRSPETPFVIKTTEAHHYRRIAVQRMQQRMSEEQIFSTPVGRGFGIRDGNGIVFVSHLGEVYPSGFLPLGTGNVRVSSLVDIYRDSALFQALRDPEQLTGKCGDCPFRIVCGGSRARAYAATGDPLASDPLCVYQPRELHS
jgi:AdoMet-dependent heme synthase